MLNRMMIGSLITLAMLMACVSDSSAYTFQKTDVSGHPGKLKSGLINLRAHAGSFPPGDPYRDWLGWVVSEWNKTPAKMVYNLTYDDSSVGENNGQNEIWFRSTMSDPAVTKMWYACALAGPCVLYEADVIFNRAEPYIASAYKPSLWEYGGSFRPFQTTAMHELGHAQGLGHTADRYSIMGTDWTHIRANGFLATAYVGEDAVAGSIALYGADAGLPDYATAHWRRTGATAGYSDHSRTRLLASNYVELPRLSGVEPTYVVNNGQEIEVEVMLESMPPGTVNSFYLALMLSSDSNINKSDKLVRLHPITIHSQDWPTAALFTMVLPTGIPAGSTRYVGVILDYFDQVTELDETNNYTYIAAVRFK